MPPAKNLSAEEERQIVAARETGETIAAIRERFGIGTTRLYRIWQEAGKMDPKPPALENQEEKGEVRGAQEEDREEEEEEEDEPFFEFLGMLCVDVRAISLYLKIIAEHLPRKDGVEEKEACVLESIENNCNAAVRAVNAAASTVSPLVQAGVVAGIVYTAVLAVKKARSQSG